MSAMGKIGARIRKSRGTAASTKSFEDAIQVGVSRAVKTLKNVEGVWVANQKCVIKNGRIAEYRVDLKVTFILAPMAERLLLVPSSDKQIQRLLFWPGFR